MPGLDRTGPLGEGPRTGKGAGLCGSGNRKTVNAVTDSYYGIGRGGLPRGGGRASFRNENPNFIRRSQQPQRRRGRNI